MDCRGVIHAIAHVSHDISGFSQGDDDPLFLIGFNFGENVYVGRALEQRYELN